MKKYTIANEDVSTKDLQSFYDSAKSAYPDMDLTDLDHIFSVACNNPDLFPAINIKGKGNNTPENYLKRWVKNYYDAKSTPPSKRSASAKSSCSDPAIKILVKTTQGLSDEAASSGEAAHNLYMSAENSQGNLLEEYISENARPYGIIWCEGNVLKATDFCSTDGSLCLQVKNKSNTENSSSSNIREGTKIEKWYRLGTKTKNGTKLPDYKWSELNKLVNTHKTEGTELSPCNMTEESYETFLKEKASENHDLITDK